MSTPVAIGLFTASLAVTLAAARQFARRLDVLGVRFGFPEALIGLLTALAADGPELSSALFALAKGAHSTSTGVLVGSCTFNLAAMIGLSALLAGRVCPERGALALEGSVALLVTVIASAMLMGWIAPALAGALATLLMIPYLGVLVGGAELLLSQGARGAALSRILVPRRAEPDPHAAPDPTHHLLGLIAVDVALIVGGSAGMVQAALTLADRWGLSRVLLGVLILGPLTSLPNAATAIRLGLAGRAAALVGETFNSNTINLVAGVIGPGLLVTLSSRSGTAEAELSILLAMTVLSLLLLAARRGLRRTGGVALIAIYAGFVAFELASR